MAASSWQQGLTAEPSSVRGKSSLGLLILGHLHPPTLIHQEGQLTPPAGLFKDLTASPPLTAEQQIGYLSPL
jgi:hypothetical protein